MKLFIVEEGSESAARLVSDRVAANDTIVAPSWAWAEVGNTLARRARPPIVTRRDADALWREFVDMPITYLDDVGIRERTWQIARDLDLPATYDAAFMAVTELAPGPATRTLWTADEAFVRRLGRRRPSYVRRLSELEA